LSTAGRSGPDPASQGGAPDQRLLEEYKIQVQSLANHYTRLWTRFNFFITLHTALLVALVGLFRDRDLSADAIPLTALGVFMGLIWYVIGAQDRYLVTFYRRQIAHAADRLAPKDDRWPHLGREVDEAVRMLAEAKTLTPKQAAETPGEKPRARDSGEAEASKRDSKRRLKESEKLLGLNRTLYQWRLAPLSVTRFPAELPLIVTVLWTAATVWVVIEAS
jgi:hypothetical protein